MREGLGGGERERWGRGVDQEKDGGLWWWGEGGEGAGDLNGKAW